MPVLISASGMAVSQSADDDILHPLDWASHLRNALVFNPTPTLMTLLVVAAHFHACCHGASPSDGGTSSSSFSHPVMERIRAWGVQSMPELFLIRETRIRTPFSAARDDENDDEGAAGAQIPKAEGFGEGGSKGESHQKHRQQAGGAQEHLRKGKAAPVLYDRIVSAVMADPMTMMYDAWSYISADANFYAEGDGDDEDHGTGDSDDGGGDDARYFTPKRSKGGGAYTGEGEQRRRKQQCRGDQSSRGGRPSSSKISPADMLLMWSDACMMHAGGAIAMGLVLLPSIVSPSMLVSNCATQGSSIRGARGSAWPVLNSCFLMIGISWTSCCMVYFVLGMPRLALCTAMHSVPAIMLAHAAAAVSCPLPPIYMPRVVSSGIGLLAGALLLCVSHMHASGATFGTEDFYMCHAWAVCGVLLCMRHTLFRTAVWMVGRWCWRRSA
jgi:hypothetical protein